MHCPMCGSALECPRCGWRREFGKYWDGEYKRRVAKIWAEWQ